MRLLHQRKKKKHLTKSNTHHYKNSHKTRNKGESPQFDKVHLPKKKKKTPAVNIMLKGEKLDTFPINSGTRKVFEK